MKTVLSILITCCGILGAKALMAAPMPFLQYQIGVVEASHAVSIQMTFKGNARGQSVIQLPKTLAGHAQLYRYVYDKQAMNASLTSVAKRPDLVVLRYKPGQMVSLKYKVKQSFQGAPNNQTQFLAPIMQETYFQTQGGGILAFPAEIKAHEALTLSIIWQTPKTWVFADSYGANEAHQQVKTNLRELLSSLFLAGDYRLEAIRTPHGNRIWFAIRGQWKFSDEELKNTVFTIVHKEREFWNAHHNPYFLVSLIPAGKVCHQIGGTGYTHYLAAYMGSDCGLNPQVLTIFSHESFHAWNNPIIFTNPDHPAFWFSEGFTNYYANLLNLRTGLMSMEDYIRQYNKTISAYYLSPMHLTPLAKTQGIFLKNEDLRLLPYQQGEILAHNWNSRIMTESNGQASLDSLMKHWVVSEQPQHSRLNMHALELVSKHYMKHGIAADILALKSGNLLKPDPHALGPCVKLVDTDLGPYEAGFDLFASIKTKTIIGVKPHSNAYEAGLRDGQVIQYLKATPNEASLAFVLKVWDQHQLKEIQFLPYRKQGKAIPQFVMDKALWQKDKNHCMAFFKG